MLDVPLPPDEVERLESLRRLDPLAGLADERFDRIARLARRLFSVPIALISLVDAEREWYIGRAGLDETSHTRQVGFGAHTILHPEGLVVADARADPRFAFNALVLGDTATCFY